ncbi:hypothetical protein PIB30_020049 [Stylosanthes scabra]|uniref:Uncharacterized protein n=1 Tax=Stylosanthes scabra TaxID=79078 RepID=A0ABU6T893_9FABA|nr:hypothetical protein [Stylosanthes scabra]
MSLMSSCKLNQNVRRKVCQTCGNRGFSEALDYCMTYGEASEHNCCLEKVAEDLSEDIVATREVNPSVAEGHGTGKCVGEVPYTKEKRKLCASKSASPEIGRKIRSMIKDYAEAEMVITMQNVAGETNVSGLRKGQ